MLPLSSYSNILGSTGQADVFDFLLQSIAPSVYDFDYLMNCTGAQAKVQPFDDSVSDVCDAMSTPNWQADLLALFVKSKPARQLGKALLAYREPKFMRLPRGSSDSGIKTYNLSSASDLLKVLLGTGVIHLLEGIDEQPLRHLLLGIELGLDSNGRKNRGGHAMEQTVEAHLQALRSSFPLEFVAESTPKKIVELGWASKQDLAPFGPKRFDFAVRYKGRTSVIETNYYSSAGSKLKSTANEYIQRGEATSNSKIKFIWITDGNGWKKTHEPLRQAHESLDFVMNLELMKGGVLLEALGT
jgi:type II restriction enzyme